MSEEYEYEVAFSFLQEDELLAFQINDLIQDRFKTFIYSQEQKLLAGSDGEKTFNQWAFSDKDGKILDSGKSIELFKMEDGKWKMFRDCYNSDMPIPSK